jgi:hypothetical protein
MGPAVLVFRCVESTGGLYGFLMPLGKGTFYQSEFGFYGKVKGGGQAVWILAIIAILLVEGNLRGFDSKWN